MLWKVKIMSFPVIACATKEEAHAKVVKMLKDNPEAFIAGIEDARLGQGHLLKRLFTGR